MEPYIVKQVEDINENLEILNVFHLLDKYNNNISICNIVINNQPILVELEKLKVIHITNNYMHLELNENMLQLLNHIDLLFYNLIDLICSFDNDCIIELKNKILSNELKYSSLVKKNNEGSYYIKILYNDETKINTNITLNSMVQCLFLIKNFTFLTNEFLCGISQIARIINVFKIYEPLSVSIDNLKLTEMPKQQIFEDCDDFKTEVVENNVIQVLMQNLDTITNTEKEIELNIVTNTEKEMESNTINNTEKETEKIEKNNVNILPNKKKGRPKKVQYNI
jgi:hypothetical protein